MKLTQTAGVPAQSKFIPAEVHARDDLADPARRWARMVCVLFFFSGFPALIYQLVWQRALFRIFGVNIESVTIVVTAFMLGLGLGGLAGGWLSKRRGVPLLPLLATIELLTGLFGSVSLSLFTRVGSHALGMPLAVTALAALLLVAVPTLLMGATLPILVGHLVKRTGNVGGSVGRLYYVNTLGAGTACLVSALLILPFLGMQTAIYVAVALNAVVALAALVAHRREPPAIMTVQAQPIVVAAKHPTLRFAAAAALAFGGGLIALSYEIFFVRTVAFAEGGGASAFALTLGAFLIGLASGSRKAAEWCDACGDDGPRHVASSVLKASVLGILFLPVLAHLGWSGRGMIGIALLMVYLVARYWGSLLPCLTHFGVTPTERAGSRTSWLYFANIAGSVSGSILTGFVLMNHLGLVEIAALLGAAGLACAVLLAAVLSLPDRSRWQYASVAVLGTMVAFTLLPTLSAGILETLLWKGAPEQKVAFTAVVENRNGIIVVDRANNVYGNGMYDGRFSTDLVDDANGIVRPYALSLFHRQPHDVLMIGLSSASWAQVIASNPEVKSLTVVEINPGYLKLIARTPEVASVLTNPKVHIITDDGRRWLRLNPTRQFDAIVSNNTWYFRENSANLLSSEYLALIKQHMKADGIYFYNTTDSERVQRTACSEFPYGARFGNHMLVSKAPLVWDFNNWRRTLEAYQIDGRPVLDLSQAVDRTRLAQLMALKSSVSQTNGSGLAQPIEACSGVMQRTAGKMLVTDDNMGSEYRHLFGME